MKASDRKMKIIIGSALKSYLRSNYPRTLKREEILLNIVFVNFIILSVFVAVICTTTVLENLLWLVLLVVGFSILG